MHKSGSLETLRRITHKKESTIIIGDMSSINTSITSTSSTDPDSGEDYLDPNLKYDSEDLRMIKKEQKTYQKKKETKEYWNYRNKRNSIPKINLMSSSPDTINSVLTSIRTTETAQLQDSVLITRQKRQGRAPKLQEQQSFNNLIVPIPETIQLETPVQRKGRRWKRGLSLSPRFLLPPDNKKSKIKMPRTKSFKILMNRGKNKDK